jgi:branched-subunit amino acid aminotransferase/4-amino-4-deoxychorismate lyase
MAELDGSPAGPEALQALALTNYGHFTTMRVEDGRVRGLSLHLERLVRDCRAVFDAVLDPGRVRELVRRAVPGVGTVVVRVTVFDPDLDVGHVGGEAHPKVLVTTRPAATRPLPPLRVGTVTHVREMPGVKNVGLFGILRYRRAMARRGLDDVLFADHAGHISEGGMWNIGFVRAGDVVWPDAEYLPGVTMELLKHVHPHTIAPVGRADVAGYEAAFATNAAVGVQAIIAIDGHEFPAAHPLTGLLREKYLAVPAESL